MPRIGRRGRRQRLFGVRAAEDGAVDQPVAILASQDDREVKFVIQKRDPIAKWDTEIMEKSRKNVLEMADWVIPGHGKMFKAK